MSSVTSTRPDRLWLATAGAFVVILTGWRLFHLAPIDDAYIFLRYARHWAQGLGPVFNPGQRVEGYSSPLWLALLALGQVVAPGSSFLAQLAGAVCAALTIGMVVAEALRRSVPPRYAWSAGVFLATNPGLAYWSCSGMDTTLFCLLVSASLIHLAADLEGGRVRPVTATLLAAGCLARMEGVLLVAVAFGYAWTRSRSLHYRWLILTAVVIGASLLARRLYYGAWLPNTYYAKATGDRSVIWMNGVRYLGTLAATHGGLLAALAACLWLALKAGPLPVVAPFIAVLSVWPLYMLLAGGDHFAMARLIQPLVPIAVLTGLLALKGIRGRFLRMRPAILLLAVLALLSTDLVEWKREAPRALSEMDAGTRWTRLGIWLERRVPPDAWIAAVPIGGIGWGSQRPILDLTGLTDATIARHGMVDPEGRPGHLKFHTTYVLERAPAYVYLGFGGPTSGDFQLYRGYSMALEDLLRRQATRTLYRPEVVEVAPRLFAQFLVKRDAPSLTDR